jgi:hypothetical protein
MLGYTIGAEIGVLLVMTSILTHRGDRVNYLWKAVVATPMRYFLTLFDLVIFGAFLVDIWVIKDFKWRK